MVITTTILPSRRILFNFQKFTLHTPMTKTSTMATLLLFVILLMIDVWFGPLSFTLKAIFTFTIFNTLQLFHCIY